MFLKNYLIEVFKKASLENNVLLKENIVLKWVHRFGIDTLNDLLIHSPTLQENQHKKEKQEQISLIDESKQDENKNEELISIELLKTTENQEEIKGDSTDLDTSRKNEIISKKLDSNQIKNFTNTHKLPLPNINNLRKWINNDKRAS